MKTRYFNSALSILFLFVMIGMPGQVFAENVLKIGGSLTTTGPAAHLGTVCLNGVKVAVDVINEKGGVEVGGEKYLIEFINYDDKCSAKDAVNVVQRLVEKDNVTAILGAICSHATLAFMPYIKDKKIPTVTAIAASMKVTTKENQYMLRTGAQTGMQSETITRFAFEDLGLKKAAFIGRNDAWAKSAADQFKRRVEARGGTITAMEYYELGSTDFYSQLAKIKRSNPEFVWMVSLSEDGALLLKQAREMGLSATIFGTDEFSNEFFFELAGQAANNAYFYWGGGPPKEDAKEYEKIYQKKYGIKSIGLDKVGYDTLLIMADAIDRADSLEGEKIKDAFYETDFNGIRGYYSFSETGQAMTEMWIGKNEDLKTVYVKKIDVYDNPPFPVDRDLD
jgi:branched-chain amino acid transport system substrate-binding protein